MVVKSIDMHDITSVGTEYRVYPKNSDYPHVSIALSDITGTAKLGTYTFMAFHWSREKVSARVTFTEDGVNAWQCDQDGKFQTGQRKVDVTAAKKIAQLFLKDCGHDNTWSWTTV